MVVVLAYLPVIIIGFLVSEDLSLSFDILFNAFYSFFGILVISQVSVNWQMFTKFHGFITIFIIISASILIYYSSHGSNTGVRNLGLSGNDNRFSSLLIICLVVISNVLPRIVNWFLGGLLFFSHSFQLTLEGQLSRLFYGQFWRKFSNAHMIKEPVLL